MCTGHYILLRFFLFSERRPRWSLNESQPNFATCSEVSQTWKCTSRIWRSPLLKRGRLKREYLRNETRYRQTGNISNANGPPYSSPKFWTLAHKRLAVCMICGALGDHQIETGPRCYVGINFRSLSVHCSLKSERCDISRFKSTWKQQV